MDKIFAQHRMCDRRKIKNAASSLTSRALIWWKDLCDYYEDPQTWKDMKRCLKNKFVSDVHSIKLICELQCLQQHEKTVKEYYKTLNTLLLHCGLDESEEVKETRFLNGINSNIYDILVDMEYNSLYDLFNLACEIENTIKQDTCFAEIEYHDAHIVEQPAVEPLIEIPLLQDDCRLVSCNKEEFCDDASVIVVPQIINKDDIVAPQPISCAENKIFLPLTCV